MKIERFDIVFVVVVIQLAHDRECGGGFGCVNVCGRE